MGFFSWIDDRVEAASDNLSAGFRAVANFKDDVVETATYVIREPGAAFDAAVDGIGDQGANIYYATVDIAGNAKELALKGLETAEDTAAAVWDGVQDIPMTVSYAVQNPVESISMSIDPALRGAGFYYQGLTNGITSTTGFIADLGRGGLRHIYNGVVGLEPGDRFNWDKPEKSLTEIFTENTQFMKAMGYTPQNDLERHVMWGGQAVSETATFLVGGLGAVKVLKVGNAAKNTITVGSALGGAGDAAIGYALIAADDKAQVQAITEAIDGNIDAEIGALFDQMYAEIDAQFGVEPSGEKTTNSENIKTETEEQRVRPDPIVPAGP